MVFDRKQTLYLWLGGLFVTALLIADLIGAKLFRVGGIDLSVGMLAFPLTFVLTDLLSEFYGPKGARRVTYLGLGCAAFAFFIINVAIAVPTSPESPMPGPQFSQTFGWSQRLYVASLTAYTVGQLLDITIFTALRRLTKHRLLWLRATGSTLASQLIDTVMVTFMLFTGTKSTDFILTLIRNQYLLKVAIAVGLTPVIYAAHAFVLRILKIGETPEPV